MKISKIALLAALGCFVSLPLAAADGPKAEVKKTAKKKKSAHVHHEPALPTEPTVMATAPAADSTTSLKVSGRVNAVMNYDLNGFGGDYLYVGAIPFDSKTIQDKQKQLLTGNVKASRLGFTSTTKTANGELKGHIEADFYGSTSGPSTYDVTEPTSSSTLILRDRKAYVDYAMGACSLRIGRDDSLFVTYAQIDTVDFSGHFGGGLRPIQARYSHKFSDVVTAAVGLERTTTDIMMSTGTAFTTGNGIRGQNMPDILGKVSANVGDHQFALRGVTRFASVSDTAGSNTKTAMGYGVGGDVKLSFMKRTDLVALVNYGQGIGAQINDNSGLSFVWDSTNNTLKAQTMIEYGAGVSHAFNDHWKLNVAYAKSTVTKDDSLTPGANYLTKDLQRMFANIMFSPVKDLTFGLEYAQGDRTSQTTTNTVAEGKGARKRVVLGVVYKF